jgi:hypothetical protein
MILTGKETEAGGKKPIPVPVSSSQIPHEMAWKKREPLR